jgi:hypothetical protein
MQPRTLNLLVLISVLLLTFACGATPVWLALQNPTLTDKLFYALLGTFTAGAAAIIGLTRGLGLHRQGDENPSLAPPNQRDK